MFRLAVFVGFLSLLAAPAWAQWPVSIGVKGGVALTDAFENNTFSYQNRELATIVVHNYSPSKDYLVGPFVELRLPFGLGVEADALYRQLHFATVDTGVTTPDEIMSNSWEFPILAKYRFKLPVARPYIDAGPSFRTASNKFSASTLSNHGFAAGVGVDIKALLLHISPEIRYTRWGSDTIPAGAIAPPYSNRNQIEFLVGVAF